MPGIIKETRDQMQKDRVLEVRTPDFLDASDLADAPAKDPLKKKKKRSPFGGMGKGKQTKQQYLDKIIKKLKEHTYKRNDPRFRSNRELRLSTEQILKNINRIGEEKGIDFSDTVINEETLFDQKLLAEQFKQYHNVDGDKPLTVGDYDPKTAGWSPDQLLGSEASGTTWNPFQDQHNQIVTAPGETSDLGYTDYYNETVAPAIAESIALDEADQRERGVWVETEELVQIADEARQEKEYETGTVATVSPMTPFAPTNVGNPFGYNDYSNDSYSDYSNVTPTYSNTVDDWSSFSTPSSYGPHRNHGGEVFMSDGGESAMSKGTDTVDAILTPGEFVVDADSAQRFKPQLEAMNKWKPEGGFEGAISDLDREINNIAFNKE